MSHLRFLLYSNSPQTLHFYNLSVSSLVKCFFLEDTDFFISLRRCSIPGEGRIILAFLLSIRGWPSSFRLLILFKVVLWIWILTWVKSQVRPLECIKWGSEFWITFICVLGIWRLQFKQILTTLYEIYQSQRWPYISIIFQRKLLDPCGFCTLRWSDFVPLRSVCRT